MKASNIFRLILFACVAAVCLCGSSFAAGVDIPGTMAACSYVSPLSPEIDVPGALTAFAMAAPAGVIIKKFDVENLTIVSLEEYEKLKAKYRHIYVLDIQIDEDEKYQFIARRPSRDLLSAVAATNDNDKANELVIKNMVVAGDTSVLDDGLVYSGLIKELTKLMKLGHGFLAKA